MQKGPSERPLDMAEAFNKCAHPVSRSVALARSVGQYRIEAVSTGLAFESAQIVDLTLAGLPDILACQDLAADNCLRVLQGDFCIVLLSIRHGRVVSTRYQSRQRSPSSRCARAKQA